MACKISYSKVLSHPGQWTLGGVLITPNTAAEPIKVYAPGWPLSSLHQFSLTFPDMSSYVYVAVQTAVTLSILTVNAKKLN